MDSLGVFTDSRKDCAVPDLIVLDQSLSVGLLLGKVFKRNRLPLSSSFTDEKELFLIIPSCFDVCGSHGRDVGRLSAVETFRLLGCSAANSSAGLQSGVKGDEALRLVSL